MLTAPPDEPGFHIWVLDQSFAVLKLADPGLAAPIGNITTDGISVKTSNLKQ